jgi:hypothetical protein
MFVNQEQLLEKIRQGESFLVANDGQFLGKLSLNRYDTESISNPYGDYGSRYSNFSIYNPYGDYGSRYSSLSPFNPYSSTPPNIYLNGQFYGYLTKNRYMGTNSLDPENVILWMRSNNLNY